MRNKKLLYIFFIAWIILLLKLTLFKHSIPEVIAHFRNYDPDLFRKSYARAGFIPFVTLKDLLFIEPDRGFAYRNLFGNILMFLPAGFLLPALFPLTKKVWSFILCCLSISLCLEILQLLTALGDFDVDDLLLNTAGGIMGYGIYQVVKPFDRL